MDQQKLKAFMEKLLAVDVKSLNEQQLKEHMTMVSHAKSLAEAGQTHAGGFGSVSVNMPNNPSSDGHQQAIDFYNQEVDNLAIQADPEFQAWIDAAEEKLVATIRDGKDVTHLAKVLSAQQVKKFGGKTIGQELGSMVAGRTYASFTREIKSIMEGPVARAGQEIADRNELLSQISHMRSVWGKMSPGEKQELANKVGYSIEELEYVIRTGQLPNHHGEVEEGNNFLQQHGHGGGKFPEPRKPSHPGDRGSKSETMGKDGLIYHWQDPRAKQGVAEASDPEREKLTNIITKYFGRIYDGGDDALDYLDANAPIYRKVVHGQYEGDLDSAIAEQPVGVLKQIAIELKNIAGDLTYKLGEQGVAEGSSKDLSKVSTEKLQAHWDKHKDQPGISPVFGQQLRAVAKELARRKQGVTEGEDDFNPVASAITRRIMLQRTDLLSKYGPEQVGNAIDEVADFVGDVDEIGSSDVSGWVKHVERLLGNMNESVHAEAFNRLKKVFKDFKG